MKFLAKYKEIGENRSTNVKVSNGQTFTSFVTGVTIPTRASPGGESNEV